MAIKKITLKFATREEWLAARLNYVGGSESPALFGQSNYATPYSLWVEKTTGKAPDALTDEMIFGTEVEPVVVTILERKFGGKAERWRQTDLATHNDFPHMSCTPDGWYECEERPGKGTMQIKTASEFQARELAEDIPLAWEIQCQHEMAVTEAPWCALVVLVGRKLQRIFIERHEPFINALRRRVASFWQHVTDGTAPPVDGSLITSAALRRLHPDDNGCAVQLPDNADAILETLDEAKRAGKQCEQTQEFCRNILRAAIGSNTYGVTQTGRVVSHKTQTRPEHVVPETTCRALLTSKRQKLPADVQLVESEDVRKRIGNGSAGIDGTTPADS